MKSLRKWWSCLIKSTHNIRVRFAVYKVHGTRVRSAVYKVHDTRVRSCLILNTHDTKVRYTVSCLMC